MRTIVPELATSWSWDKANTALTFKLREGVTWHDGKPFTSKDVKCTMDLLLDKNPNDKLRKNPRKGWFEEISDVTTNGDFEVTMHLKRPQPSLLAMFASGYTPMYPCHVPSAQQRTHPIGTGPFMFGEEKQNESIKLVKNPHYWKKGLPYLDGIEYTIIKNRATAVLAFVAGKVDVTFPTEMTKALEADIKKQDPTAICEIGADQRQHQPDHQPRQAAVRQCRAARGDEHGARSQGLHRPDPARRRATSAARCCRRRKASGACRRTCSRRSPATATSRRTARRPAPIMTKLGYSPDKPLKIKVSTRNLATYRDPAVVLIDQLKSIWIDAELEPVESSAWFAKVARGDYTVGLNLTGNGIDDPDQAFYENYGCGSQRNYTHYCNKDLQKLFDQQSQETDVAKRKKLVWEIDKKIQEDVARPILYPRAHRHLLEAVREEPDGR